TSCPRAVGNTAVADAGRDGAWVPGDHSPTGWDGAPRPGQCGRPGHAAVQRARSHEAPEPAAIVVHQDVTALKEAEALKDEFLGLVAHELRHPVAVLSGLAETLLQDGRSGIVLLTAWQREALQGIDQAAFHLVRLTDELLDA